MIQRVVTIVQEITELVEHDFDDLQSFFSISQEWPMGETRLIDGSFNTKIYQDDRKLRFITRMPPGVVMGKHWHDCAETCTVLAGTLSDFRSNRVWHTNEVAMFSKGEKHEPGNPSDTNDLYLLVEFQTVNIN